MIIDRSVNSSGSVRVNNNLIYFFDGSKLYQYDTNLNQKWVVTPSDLTSYKTTSEVFAFDSSGNIYLIGLYNIFKYNSSGFLISTISLNGITPTCIYVDANNNIYYGTSNNTLVKINSSGTV